MNTTRHFYVKEVVGTWSNYYLLMLLVRDSNTNVNSSFELGKIERDHQLNTYVWTPELRANMDGEFSSLTYHDLGQIENILFDLNESYHTAN